MTAFATTQKFITPPSYTIKLPSKGTPIIMSLNGLGGPATAVPLTKYEQWLQSQKEDLALQLQLVINGKESSITYRSHLIEFLQKVGSKQLVLNMLHNLGISKNQLSEINCSIIASCLAALPLTITPARLLSSFQIPEDPDYFCGPATAAVVLIDDNVIIGPNGEQLSREPSEFWYDQAVLASSTYLNTINDGGTNWYENGKSPMADTLNAWVSGYSAWYTVVNGSGVGGGFSTSYMSGAIESDISTGWAVASGMYLVPGNTELPGYPNLNITGGYIGHWIPLVGYYDNGNYIQYADPVYGSSINNEGGWNVPGPVASVPAWQMASVLNTRGFIW